MTTKTRNFNRKTNKDMNVFIFLLELFLRLLFKSYSPL